MPYTVVVTSFNSAETIGLVIKGLKELAPPPSQVILIDDASKDGSANLISRLIVDEPEFFLHVNPENRGQSYSRNLGAKLSLNEYVVFQDDDDISLPDRASIHLEALDRGADFSYVSSKKLYPNGYEIVNINSDLISSPSINPDLIKFLSAGVKLQSELRIFSPSSTLAVRKSCLEALGGFSVDLRRLEDIELACRALIYGARLAWSSRIGVERLHTLGTDKSPMANYSGELEVLRIAREFLSAREYFVARRMVTLRSAYFQRNLFAISLNLALVPLLLFMSPSKFYSIIRRIRHDLKQNQ
jgi:glycosyltransferase involved in cell wall biosynthesis